MEVNLVAGAILSPLFLSTFTTKLTSDCFPLLYLDIIGGLYRTVSRVYLSV